MAPDVEQPRDCSPDAPGGEPPGGNPAGGEPPRGWLIYDGDCALCTEGVARFGGLIGRAGLRPVPLQEAWVRRRTGLDAETLLREVRALTPEGKTLGGVDALLHAARGIWWARPVVWLSDVPGLKRLLRRVYRWVAANRHRLWRGRGGACSGCGRG